MRQTTNVEILEFAQRLGGVIGLLFGLPMPATPDTNSFPILKQALEIIEGDNDHVHAMRMDVRFVGVERPSAMVEILSAEYRAGDVITFEPRSHDPAGIERFIEALIDLITDPAVGNSAEEVAEERERRRALIRESFDDAGFSLEFPQLHMSEADQATRH